MEVRSVERQVEQCHDGVYDGSGQHDGSDRAVQAENAPQAEVPSHAVDDIRQAYPPQHCAGHDGDVAHTLPEQVTRNDKREHVEQRQKQENDQRVGQRDEKRCEEIMEQCAFVVRHGPDAFAGIRAEHVDAENEEHHAADEFHPENVPLVVDEVHDKGHAPAGHQGIYDVAEGGAGPGGKPVYAPFLHRALDAKDAYRPHGSRSDDAYQQAFQEQLDRTAEFCENIHTVCKFRIFL